MQCKWKKCLQLPSTGGQSSPGVLQLGQGISKAFIHIEQLSPSPDASLLFEMSQYFI